MSSNTARCGIATHGRIPTLTLCAGLLACAGTASADGPVATVRNLLDLTPERVQAFREALQEFSGQHETGTGADMSLVSEFMATEGFYVDALAREAYDVDFQGVGHSRDLVAEEAFFIEGREEEYEDAAKDWVERRLKGSTDLVRSRSHARMKARLGWNHGPVVGVGRGPIAVDVGEDSWRLRWSQPVQVAAGSTWGLSAFLGDSQDDGMLVGFSFGRSLLRSRSR